MFNRILFLSNGHGEDAIAMNIIKALQSQNSTLEIAALPIVGQGYSYFNNNISVIGPVKLMPSGGFIYMDNKNLIKDVKGGLLSLTWNQYKAIKKWSKSPGLIIAVGDLVPLIFAYLTGLEYIFVGTAKSEYYLRNEEGRLKRTGILAKLEGWSGSVYLPWERWLMKRKKCRGVFPRDTITTNNLLKYKIRAIDLGNPMMDHLEPSISIPTEDADRYLIIAILPGSRPKETEENWKIILGGIDSIISAVKRPILFLAAIASGIKLSDLMMGPPWMISEETLSWFMDTDALTFKQPNATLILSYNRYNEILHLGDIALAMAGTATEQFVGLGKPAIAFVGKGPQYNAKFAEAQTRLLGPSLTLLPNPDQTGKMVNQLLENPDYLQFIGENGRHRLGKIGASQRIAQYIIDQI